MDDLFPTFKKNIEDLIEDEEANIPASKLLILGTMVIILGSFLHMDAFAKHGSHSSHSSHSSHQSGTTGNTHSHYSGHNNHNNHNSHNSHTSHASHTSHSNSPSHSNSLYSAEGDVSYRAPSASKVPGITSVPVTVPNDVFQLPDINSSIEIPETTPISGFMAQLNVPAPTPDVKIETGNIHIPSETDNIE